MSNMDTEQNAEYALCEVLVEPDGSRCTSTATWRMGGEGEDEKQVCEVHAVFFTEYGAVVALIDGADDV